MTSYQSPYEPSVELTLNQPLPAQFKIGSLIEVHRKVIGDTRNPTVSNRYTIMDISEDRLTVEIR